MQGYAEAQIAAKVWKTTRVVKRPWHKRLGDVKGMTGATLDAWVTTMAQRYPAQVTA